MNRLTLGVFGAAGIILGTLPGLAQNSFDTLTLGAEKTAGTLSGTVGGSVSLPAIVSTTDYKNNKCVGFGDPQPDHRLILQRKFTTLSIRVKSGGATTLVIQGPDGVVRCADDTGSSKDASITDENWPDGDYKIWVGAEEPGVRQDYRLTIRGQ